MSSRKDDDNLLRMTKDDLLRWIQAEVDQNPHLMQRREQLAQVEDWVKQKEGEATYTRLLYSNACESVLECESVMKGLYGMMGLEYRDEDSEDEGGGIPLDILQVTDEVEDKQKNSVLNGDDDDIIVIDLGATKENLEPMLEKVTVAYQKSSRLIQDLVQMVNKTSSVSSASPSSSDISNRPSSASTPETSCSELVAPKLEIQENPIGIVRNESLPKAPEMSSLLSNSEQYKPVAGYKSDSKPTIKTEPQLTAITPWEMNISKDHETSAALNSPSLNLIKTEPQSTAVSPSETPETFASPHFGSITTVKTEPHVTLIKSDMTSPPGTSKPFRIECIASIKTEPLLRALTPQMSLLERDSEKSSNLHSDHEATSNTTLAFPEILRTKSASMETDPQVPLVTCSEMSSSSSYSEQMEIDACDYITNRETNLTEPELKTEVASLLSSCEEAETNASRDSSDKTEKLKTRGKSVTKSGSKTRLRSSKKTVPVGSTSSPQTETTTVQSPAESNDDRSETEEFSVSPADSDYEPPESQSESLSDSDYEPPKSKSKSSRDSDCEPPTSKSESSKESHFEPPKSQSESSRDNDFEPSKSQSECNTVDDADDASSNGASAEPASPDGSSKSSSSESSKQQEHKEIKLKVGMAVLAKRSHNLWCKGTVQDVQTEEHGLRYKVEFKNGEEFVLPAYHVASLQPPVLKDLFIGCRVVASSTDDGGKTSYNAAVLVELPERKNRMRFLVFYDDGHAAYLALPDLHLVCRQLKKVWKDIEDETLQLQVKEYLSVYPNPIAVVLRAGQDTKAIRNGKFEACTVLQLDGSLIQICFKKDKQKEWIYKGSDKLEHIVNIKKRLSKDKPQKSHTQHEPQQTSQQQPLQQQPSQPKTQQQQQPSQPKTQQQQQPSQPKTQQQQQPSQPKTQQQQQPSQPKTQQQQQPSQPKTQQQQPSQTKTQQQQTSQPKTQQQQPSQPKTQQQQPSQQKTQQPAITGNATPQRNTTSSSLTAVPSATLTSTTVTSTAVSPVRVTRRSDTVAKTSSVSPQMIMSAAFQPKVILQRLSVSNLRSAKRPVPDEEEENVSEGKGCVSMKPQQKSVYLHHRCCPSCLDAVRPSEVDMHLGQNPLLIPLLFKFRRMTARRRIDGKVFFHIFYRSPCGRGLCDMREVQEYLLETRCDFLFLEMFCMDPFVLVNRARPPSTSTGTPHLYLQDISEGKEVLPVPCINEVDNTLAPNISYTKDRVLAPGVSINTSPDFLIGCDCTDGCRDRSKCACHQLTIEATSLCNGGPVDSSAGYTHKRLPTTLPTGVYECNSLCRCDPRMCSNRLVQHGLQLRLELFMTQHKGWGIRCKDDVAKGTFVCVFTGKIVNEDRVNEDDTVSGNDYLANLDFIEGVEKVKEGYESEAYCSDTEVEANKKTITMKTGPLWKNTIYQEESSSGEVNHGYSGERKLSHKTHERFKDAQKNVKQMREDGEGTSGPKRCFAIKSFQRRVKPLETSDAKNEKMRKAVTGNNTRRLFNGEETCYIINARQEGNLGRFINHSCSPNLFVQNVFVDTHDLRFPWVAFFASKRIKAGTELTWDYNYEVGSVEGKVLLCCCGSLRCTGRLL
ncbi:histone-lysine N-methyltransferase SETDB1-A isoform X2 [Puntigrus tetrazona]|uniref:histone-lysine N-methyltransferase SETDB1-A isoform X2 n=1 Tax=Puntigrus tetrazona TaxID=1606681 RepID=UPI001C89FC22|nr:histone-lysine N-methyltransferase SETDB1-A isoform X2 [Puntigrus tetrazona]